MMLIHEIIKETGLTKKAVIYYVEQGIVNPQTEENGYRNFTHKDVEILSKVYVLRKLALDISEIKEVLADKSGEILRKIVLLREIKEEAGKQKQQLLSRLADGQEYTIVSKELQQINNNETILEKLLFAFPGYYGRMLTLHFSQYLKEPIQTQDQQEAFDIIIDFLDNAPTIYFPKEVQEFIDEIQSIYTNEHLKKITEATRNHISNMDTFLQENKEQINEYLKYKESDEYKNHPVSKMADILKAFNETSGYYDVFIPAMKRLSTSYLSYSEQLKTASENFLNGLNEYEK